MSEFKAGLVAEEKLPAKELSPDDKKVLNISGELYSENSPVTPLTSDPRMGRSFMTERGSRASKTVGTRTAGEGLLSEKVEILR